MFKLNPRSVVELRLSPRARMAIRSRAQAVATITRRNAVDHLYAESVTTADRPEGVVRVGTDYSFAHLDEFGSVNNPPSAAMRRAVQAVGLKMERDRRR